MACLLMGNGNHICGNDSYSSVYQNMKMEKLCGAYNNFGENNGNTSPFTFFRMWLLVIIPFLFLLLKFQSTILLLINIK